MFENLRVSQEFDVKDLERLFATTFLKDYNTQLLSGEGDPEYIPSTGHQDSSKIFYAHGFFASGLHEISHWLIAGEKRRQKRDYGYWYIPDGRNSVEQKQFEEFEAKNQGLEWLLASACHMKFFVSLDNLEQGTTNIDAFREAVRVQALNFYKRKLPSRIQSFLEALFQFYDSKASFYEYWAWIEKYNVLPE